MRFLKGLFFFVLVAVIAAIAYGFTLPDQVRVQRSIFIASKPATVFTVLNGFRQFNKWSPWAELDPKAIYTMEGPPLGVGASLSWSSVDASVGSGSQEILESQPYSRIKVQLIFGGFDGDSDAVYELTPEGQGTRLVWTYETAFNGNLLNRYFGLMLDRMIGKDYEKGLAKLKPFVESLPQEDFVAAEPELVQTTAMPIVSTSGEASVADGAAALTTAYARLNEFLQASGQRVVDAPIAITRDFNEDTRFWKFDAALPINPPCTTPVEDGSILCRELASVAAIRVRHLGPYAAMELAYRRLEAFKTVAGLQDNGSSWERYVSDASSTPEAELLTEIYWPVK